MRIVFVYHDQVVFKELYYLCVQIDKGNHEKVAKQLTGEKRDKM